MEVVQIIAKILTFLNDFHIQLLAAELLFCFRLLRKDRIIILIPLALLYSAVPGLLPESFFWHGFMIGDWFTFSFILIFLFSLLLIWVGFKIPSYKEVIFYGAASCIAQHLVHNVYMIFCMKISLTNGLLSGALQLILAIIIYTLFYFIFVRRLLKGDVTGVHNVFLIFFTLFSMFIIFFLSLWTTLEETETIGSNLFDCFCCVLLLLLQFGMFEWSKLQKQNEITKQLLHLEKERHAMSAENMEIINMKCHDLKYQVAALRNINNPREHEKSIKEIEHAIMIYNLSASTENEALDLVLAEKSLIFEKYSINFSCIADGKKLNFMSSTDIYSLFGNAFDNAIESVCNIQTVEKRVISLNIYSKGNCLIVNMNNYNEQDISFADDLPVTTKSNKDFHGYGMRSMRYIVENYGGTMSVRNENCMFVLNMLFPLNDVNGKKDM